MKKLLAALLLCILLPLSAGKVLAQINFVGTAVSGTRIDMTWAPSQAGWLYRWNNEGGYWNGLLAGWGVGYSDQGLTPGVTYTYVWHAVETDTWHQIWVTTPLPPSAPSGLGATAVSGTQVNLTWTDTSSNESGFKLERKTGAGGTYAQIATPAANATSYSDTGRTPGETYYYRIRATGTGGDSAYSSEANATTLTVPTAPSGLSGTPASSTQINLSWTDASNNESGFKLERKTGAGGTYAQIATPAANATSYNDTGVTSGSTYYYRVRATNGAGDSSYSTETSVDLTAPAAPTGLGGTAASSTQINLSWTDASTNETGFKLERKTGAGGTYAQIATPAANATSYNDTGVTAGSVYYYRILATNAVGDSSFSSEASVDLTVPSAPTGLGATALSSSSVRLAWTDTSGNETGFKVERKTGSGGTYAQIATPAANATSHDDSGLTPGVAYYYRVRATNAVGDSSYSNEVTYGGSTQGIYFIHPDHLNTPREVYDDQAQLRWRWDQAEPFGVTPPDENPASLGAFELPLRFPGQYSDKETNYSYNYRRDFDPAIGRYVESDPIGLKGGLNTFGYVGGNPLSFVDPSGLLKWSGKFKMGSLGIGKLGGFKAQFELESECDIDGMKGFATVEAYGATLGVGLPSSGVWGSIQFVDANIRVDPEVFRGRARVNSIGVQLGPIGLSKTSILLGGAIANDVDDSGIDIGIALGIGGFADVVNSRKECCNK